MNTTVAVKVLQHPVLILAAIVGGTVVGILCPNLSLTLKDYGSVFLALLELCFIPIILSAVAISVHNLVASKVARKAMGRITIVSLAFMVLSVLLGLLFSYLLHPGQGLLASSSAKIHEISLAASVIERSLNQPLELTSSQTFVGFLLELIPRNIFTSLGNSKVFQVVIFAIIVGVTMGFLSPEQEKGTQKFFETLFEIFRKIIFAVGVFLPIGIFCLIAGDVGKVGPDTVLEMGSFIAKVYGVYIMCFILFLIVIKVRSGQSYSYVIESLKDALFLSFGTRSSIVSIPSTIAGMADKLKFNLDLVDLMVPLGNIVGRFGNMIYFSAATIFTFELYHMPLTVVTILTILPLTMLAGIGTAGTSGILTLTMLALVLDIFQLPIGAILPLLIAVDSLIEPMRTLMNVFVNCASISVICPKPEVGKL